jgi:hypothetical protein
MVFSPRFCVALDNIFYHFLFDHFLDLCRSGNTLDDRKSYLSEKDIPLNDIPKRAATAAHFL